MVSALLAAVMGISLLAGCGTQGNDDSKVGSATNEDGSVNFDEDPYTIAFPIITLGEAPVDMQMVEDALNEYLLEKINAQVEMEAISMSNLTNTYTLKASGGEKMDIISMLPASTQLLPMVNSNMLLELDDLLDQYGQDVIDSAGEILEAGKVGGVQYFIPCFEDAYTAKGGLTFNSELVKKYDLEDEIQAIQSLEDLEPLLQLIKENEPGVIPFTAELAGNYQTFMFGYDNLGDGFGVLDLTEGDGSDLQVVNWYETDTFMENSKLMRDWFEKGYISQDAATSQDGGSVLVPSGAAFCEISSYAPNQDEGFDLNNSMVEIPLGDTKQMHTWLQDSRLRQAARDRIR